METLAELEARRAFECRLTPDRSLQTLDDAEAFLRERGLLTRTPDTALPSLYEACHERPYKAGAPGFATWPATKWPWFGELGRRYLVLKVHRGKNLLVTDETARVLDPICRGELERLAGVPLLAHLEAAGPSLLEDVRVELGLTPKELKGIREPLERCGALVARSTTLGRAEETELARWDQVAPERTGAEARDGFAELLVTAVRAAVVAPEHELRRWFSWPWNDALAARLVDEGRLRRVDGHVTAG